MSTTLSLAKDAVLFLLAIYGAVLSTFNWRQAVRKDKRVVDVRRSTAMPTYGAKVGPFYARITATNIGHRPVTVTTISLELAGSARLAVLAGGGLPGVPDTQLPATLSDGQSAQVYFSYAEVGEALMRSGRTAKTKLTPVCEDSAGGTYRGEPWEVDPREIMRM